MGKLEQIIQEEIESVLEGNRSLGKRLSDIKGKGLVKTYRAVAEGVDTFKDRDFVTLSLKFAVGHAENNDVYEMETQQVIEAFISAEDLYQATQPGEYLYSGEDKKGKVVYKTKGVEGYEGYEELTKADFLNEGMLDEGVASWFKSKSKWLKDKAIELKKDGIREGYETVLAAKILMNVIKKRDVTPEEVKFLKSQSVDLAKVIGLLGLQAVPGNNAIIAVLEKVFKKAGIPFSFYPDSHKNSANAETLKKAYPKKELAESIRRRLSEIEDNLRQLDEEQLDETQTGQKDLQKLATEILFEMGKNMLMQKEHGEKIDQYNFPMVMTSALSNKGYGEIDEFLNSVNIPVVPVSMVNKSKTTDGVMRYGKKTNQGGESFQIELKIPKGLIEVLNKELESDDVTYKDLYSRLYGSFHSTLLHELQHAYDAWRSEGKALSGQKTKGYKDIQKKAQSINVESKDLTPEEIKALDDSTKAYMNLVHEINARFAEAIANTSLKDIDFKTFEKKKGNWKKVFREFKRTFEGWDILSDKMKRKLIRRLAKAFEEEMESGTWS